jgi:hypothetical protein
MIHKYSVTRKYCQFIFDKKRGNCEWVLFAFLFLYPLLLRLLQHLLRGFHDGLCPALGQQEGVVVLGGGGVKGGQEVSFFGSYEILFFSAIL